MVLPLTRSFCVQRRGKKPKQRTQYAANSCLRTRTRKNVDLHADVKAALVLAAVMSLSGGGLRHRRRRLLRHLRRVRQDRRRRAQLRQ